MEKKSRLVLSLLLHSFALAACSKATPQIFEVTRLAPQTAEVTRVVTQTVIVTHAVEETTSITQESTINTEVTPQMDIDPAYFDGIIVITQYYMFLGHGLYEEAYRLLSSSAQKHSKDVDDYIKGARSSFKSVEIITIQPYYLWANERDSQASPETDNERRFYVQIIAEGEGNMSGSVLNGTLQTIFLSLIQENGEWKIDTFATIAKK